MPSKKQHPKKKSAPASGWFKTQYGHFMAKSKKRRVALVALWVILVWLSGMLLFGSIYQYQHHNDPVDLGVSFTKSASEDLGLDWRKNFTALLDDLHIRHYRLMSYWEESESTRGHYDFTDLDWQMNEVAKRGGSVSLSVGLRQPRWPECHQPEWAKTLYSQDKQQWRSALNDYMTVVVNRYKNHPALASWHLENEYFNRNFGDCHDFSKSRLAEERDMIHRLDRAHPVVITLADQLGFPFTGPHPDIYSTSLYKGNYVKYLGYFPYPIPTHFYSAKAYFVKLLHGKDMYIHELQLEPWGPKPNKDLSISEQDYYMNTNRMQSNINFALDTGMKRIDMWGGEWWYWRKEKLHDNRPWMLIKKAVQRNNIY